MQSLKQAIQGFNMEVLRQRAAANRNNPKSTPENGTIPTYQCQQCKDEFGYFVKRPVTQTVKGELVEVFMDHWVTCECVEQRRETERMNSLMKSSKITIAFQNKTFENFNLNVADPIRDAFRKARVYQTRFKDIRETSNNGICLLGQPGCGKTHLAIAIANALIADGIEVLYFPFVQGIEEMKNDMKKDELNKERIEKMQKVEVLFIDDLFKPPNKPTEYEIRKMYEVINYRYLEQLPIIISSEKSINDLVDIDEALGSRINEMCKDFRVLLKGGRELNYRMREDTA